MNRQRRDSKDNAPKFTVNQEKSPEHRTKIIIYRQAIENMEHSVPLMPRIRNHILIAHQQKVRRFDANNRKGSKRRRVLPLYVYLIGRQS
uniref:Uncharacterized protein n=1 Tax=Romanomermis culicivorax TaxID=13658 RepID=A0A915KVS6_ROMCU